jgi:Skp family chaperone for outer membrane proteins
MSQQLKTAALMAGLLLIAFCLPLMGMEQDAKIAVVDTQALTVMSDEGKIAGEKIEKRIQEMTVEMDRARKSIEEKENRLRTQDRLMAAAAKTQLQNEIRDDQIKFDRKSEDYQKEIEQMQNTLMSPIAAKVQAELATWVNEKSYDLLIDLSVETGGVVWSNPANNITKDLLVRVNESFKKAPAPAAAAPPAATPPRAPAATPAASPATAPATKQ